jgi:thiamine biosynthesis lipoprotein
MPLPTSKNKPAHNWQFEAIGTQWSIETARALDVDERTAISELIDSFDRTYSRFRDDSLVSSMATKAGVYTFPGDALQLIGFYRELYRATNGAVSPLVGQLLSEAGYDKTYSLQPGQISKVPAWDEVMQWDDLTVEMSRPALLDFGAAGKGYLADLVGELLERSGYEQYVVDASGDIRTRGITEVVGLENPFDASTVIGAVPLRDASLCASATNRRTWGDWHHIVDPKRRLPMRSIVATWVVGSSTMVADGLATALFFVPAKELSGWEFQYVRLHANGMIERSEDFVGELYI